MSFIFVQVLSRAAFGLFALCFIFDVAAQQTPSRGQLGLEEYDDSSSLEQRSSSEEEFELNSPRVRPEMNKPLEEYALSVSRYEVIGVSEDIQQLLNAELLDLTGENISFEMLANAASRVTRYLQSELGLYLAYAYLPAQDIENGVVVIQALPGVLGKVDVAWPEDELNVSRDVILAYLDQLKPGEVIRVSDVERVAFLVNDLRGVGVSFTVTAGSEVGTADIIANVINHQSWGFSSTIDNHGSELAGSLRVGLSANLFSPLDRGDVFTVSMLSSADRGLGFGLLSYVTPIGANGLKLGVNASAVQYKLDKQVLPVGVEGDSTTVGVFGTYPWLRSRNLNLFTSFSYEERSYADRLVQAQIETEKSISVNNFRLTFDSRDSIFQGGINTASFSWDNYEIGYPSGRPSGLDNAERPNVVKFEASRLQTLIPSTFYLLVSARGQRASANLDGSLKCSLGGASGVRAYKPGVGAGDSCWIAGVELRYARPIKLFEIPNQSIAGGFFYDTGWVQRRITPLRALDALTNEFNLSAYGIAIRWEIARKAQFEITFAKSGPSSKAAVTEGVLPDFSSYASLRYFF